MKTNNNTETRFETILKSMSHEDKKELWQCLAKAEELLKENCQVAPYENMNDIMFNDEVFRNIWMGSTIAMGHWFKEEKEMANAQ